MDAENKPMRRPPSEYWNLLADLEGHQIVSVHVKRTYRLQHDGQCLPASREMPLLMAPLVDPDGDEVFWEGDVMPVKSGTDLIVLGNVYGFGARSLVASIALPQARVAFQVFGARRCSFRGPGTLRFSEPEPIDILPLCYENAYGGIDPTVADQRSSTDLLEAMEHAPGVYPRNPLGKGYAVFENRERLDGLELPNIEHPQMLVTPDNFVLDGPQNWPRAPLPWSSDWFPRTWFPRCVYQGVLPEYFPADDRELHEVRAGWLQPGETERLCAEGPEWDYRVFNAAAPALVLPHLRGDERIELVGLTENRRIVVTLPNQPPVIAVRHAGREHAVMPVVHRVLISTDEMGVSIVWQGAWRTPFELPERQPRPGDDLRALLGVDVTVDGRTIETAL